MSIRPIDYLRHFLTDAAQTIEKNEKCRPFLTIDADEQHHEEAMIGNAIRSMLINGQAPGRRAPAQNLGVGHIHFALMRQFLKAHEACKGFYIGNIHNGDPVDANSIQEAQWFSQVNQKIKASFPWYRELVRVSSNHSSRYAGVMSGPDELIVSRPVLLLDHGSGRDLKKDIHELEVGTRYGKDKEVRRNHKDLYGKALTAKEVTVLSSVSDSQYWVFGERHSNYWSFGQDAQYRFHRFWRPLKAKDDPKSPEIYGALVRIVTPNEQNKIDAATREFAKRHHGTGPTLDEKLEMLSRIDTQDDPKDLHPERKWLYLYAVKLHEFEYPAGSGQFYPVYTIALDTSDDINGKGSFAALKGMISNVQAHVAKAFLDKMLEDNPNALFITNSHYRIEKTPGVLSSGLVALYNHPAVIAHVAAHDHSRDFTNLATPEWQHELGIRRKTPLYQITVPAVIDYPNEITSLKLDVIGGDKPMLNLDFEFIGLDRSQLPGLNETVVAELERRKPDLLIYEKAIDQIAEFDRRNAAFAQPRSKLSRALTDSFGIDEGMAWDAGHLSHMVIKNDTIPTQFEAMKSYVSLYTGMINVALIEAGLPDHAEAVTENIEERMRAIVANYEKVTRKAQPESDKEAALKTLGKKDAQAPEKIHQDFADLLTELSDISNAVKKGQNPKISIHAGKEAEFTLAVDQLKELDAYLSTKVDPWVKQYDLILREKDRPAEEFVPLPTLFGDQSFRSMQKRHHEIPKGSATEAFVVLAGLEGAKQRKQYNNTGGHFYPTVSDRIQIQAALDKSEVLKFESFNNPLTVEQKAALDEEYKHIPGTKPGWQTRHATHEEEPLEDHWTLHAGWRTSYGDFNAVPLAYPAFVARAGHLWHVAGFDNNSWKLNVSADIAAETDGPLGPQIPLSIAFGAQWLGLISIDLFGRAGVTLGESGIANPDFKPYGGLGWRTCLFEGTLCFEGGFDWYDNSSGSSLFERSIAVSIDLLNIGRVWLGLYDDSKSLEDKEKKSMNFILDGSKPNEF